MNDPDRPSPAASPNGAASVAGDEQPRGEARPAPSKTRGGVLKAWLRAFLLAFLVIIPLRSAVADWNVVPTSSMEPTILPGDRIFVNKLAYDLRVPLTMLRVGSWSDPARGDVVVCLSPADGIRLVKRVVAVPGDTVALRSNALTINGAPATYRSQASAGRELRLLEGLPAGADGALTHPYPIQLLPDRLAPRDFGPIEVPPGTYLVLGDNRDASADSRAFGLVPRELILGEATRVLFSLDAGLPRWDRFLSGLE